MAAVAAMFLRVGARMESNASRAHRSLEGNTLVALDRRGVHVAVGRPFVESLSLIFFKGRSMAVGDARTQLLPLCGMDSFFFFFRFFFAWCQTGNRLARRIWWQLRMKLEKYLDTAEAEVKAFQKSIDDMDSYEGCQAGFSSLVSSYTHRALAAFRGSLGSCKDSANLSGTVWCSASSMFKAHRPKGVWES